MSRRYIRYFLHAQRYWSNHPQERRGQAFYNCLRMREPETARLLPKKLNPFHTEEHFYEFLEYLKAEWAEEENHD